MQAMASAITAEAASSATGIAGILPGAPAAGHQHRAHRGDIGHSSIRKNAGEDDHRQHHHDIEPAAHPPDQALQERDQRTDMPFASIRYPTRMKNGSPAHENCRCRAHLLGEDHAGQRALARYRSMRQARAQSRSPWPPHRLNTNPISISGPALGTVSGEIAFQETMRPAARRRSPPHDDIARTAGTKVEREQRLAGRAPAIG